MSKELRDQYPINTFRGKTQDELVEFIHNKSNKAVMEAFKQACLDNWQCSIPEQYMLDKIKAFERTDRRGMMSKAIDTLKAIENYCYLNNPNEDDKHLNAIYVLVHSGLAQSVNGCNNPHTIWYKEVEILRDRHGH